MRRPRRNLGHCAAALWPLQERTVGEFLAAYAPVAQRRGNVRVLDPHVVVHSGLRYVHMCVTHANPSGTDAADIADFGEEACKRLGIELEDDYSPLLEVLPIVGVSRPHRGTPRTAPKRRRVRHLSGRGLGAVR